MSLGPLFVTFRHFYRPGHFIVSSRTGRQFGALRSRCVHSYKSEFKEMLGRSQSKIANVSKMIVVSFGLYTYFQSDCANGHFLVPLGRVHLQQGDNVKKQRASNCSFNSWLKEIDALLEDATTDKQATYNKVMAGREKYGTNGDVMWRLAKATHLLEIVAHKSNNKTERRKLAFETLEYAKIAAEIGGDNAECHKWYAIAIGSMSDFIGTKEKLLNGSLIKKHVGIALEIKPTDATLHHMLGRWCFEVSTLTWIERKVASTLFGKVPEATFDEALASLQKAHQLFGDWKENNLFLAKCCLSQSNSKAALEWIERGIAVPILGEDDEIAHKDLVSLRAQHFKSQ